MGNGASKRQSVQLEHAGVPNTAKKEEKEEFVEDIETQRVVLITGCSTGIGLAIAAFLAHDQHRRFKVYATMRNTNKKEALEEAAKDVLDDLLIVKQLDVCDQESIKSAVKEILDKEQHIDVIVNNAGVAVFSPAECVQDDIINSIFNTNVFGLMHVTNEVIPHMKSRESGHIVNISAVYGLVGLPFGEYYCSSKFAVEGYAESLAPVLNKFNIKTTMIDPGPIGSTQFTANAKVFREQTDISTADDKTKGLLKDTLMSYYQSTTSKSLEPSVIAELVKKVLLLKNPHFRYTTHPDYRQKEIQTKLSDIDGDGVMELYSQSFASH